MPWRGPSHEGDFPSVGWDLLDWYADWLRVPGGQRVGQPFVPTDEQVRFVVRLYAIDPVTGAFAYRRAALRRAKGWGKSPILAAVALGELAGPVLFDGWDADGSAVGRAHPAPWVQIAAVSERQTDNTYVALLEMLRSSPLVEEVDLDPGKTRVHFTDRPGRLEPVTASAPSAEGQPITFGVLDETHLYLATNGGHALARVMRRNVAKMGGKTVESTNAFAPGMKSVAELTEEAAERKSRGILLDTGPPVPEVKDLAHREEMLPALRLAYGDAYWVDLERVFEEANDPDTGPDNARRFYLNQIVKQSAQAFDVELWDSLHEDREVPAGELIVIGFDGARFHDATALVATHVPTGFQWPLGIWEQPLDVVEWEVPSDEVDATLEAAMERWVVWRVYADPPYWKDTLDGWAATYGEDRIVRWHTSRLRPMAFALRNYTTAMRGGDLRHGDALVAGAPSCAGVADGRGSPVLDRHIANARRRETLIRDEQDRRMFVIQKEFPESPRKIDAGMGGCLSWEARGDAIAAGASATSSTGTFYSF